VFVHMEEGMQSSASAGSTRTFQTGPIAATVFAIPAAIIVVAAAQGSSLPVLGGNRGLLLGLWVVASIMCGYGIAAAKARFGTRGFLIGAPFGIVATALVLSGLFGWSLLLTPIADAMRGSGPQVSLARAAVVGVGAIMAVKWALAWLTYLPRR
jgi:hypothetical protein